MEIVWLGHSSLRVRSNDVTLITDPFADSLGLTMTHARADVVTISNEHPHHSNSAVVEGAPRVIRGPGEYEIGDFYVSGMGTRHGEHQGERLINTIFIIRAEGLTLCHLGDLAQRLSPGQVEGLTTTDVLFVPVGGLCTLGPVQAAELVNLIGPSIVIPLHYRSEGVQVELEPLDGFLREMGVSEVDPLARLNVTSTSLPAEHRVVVLKRGG